MGPITCPFARRETISKIWLLFSVAAALAAELVLAAGLEVSLEPAQIAPGQRATLTLRLAGSALLRPATEEEPDSYPQADDSLLLQTQGLELVDQSYVLDAGDFVWTYALTAYLPGSLSLAPIAIQSGPQTFSSERMELEILATAGAGEVRPDAGPVSLPIDWRFWFRCLAWGLLGTAAWVLAKKYLPRLRATVPARAGQAVTAAENAPKDWLRQQLLVLRARLDSSPEDPRHADAWCHIIRAYASRATSQPVEAWTTSQMEHRLPVHPWSAVLTLFKECDGMRFTSQTANTVQSTLRWIEQSERILL